MTIPKFDISKIKQGSYLFIGISIITYVGLFFYTGAKENIHIFKEVKILYLLLALVLVAIDLYLGGYRNHIFIKDMDKGVKLMASLKANVANLFMGSITPSQTGGGPAQWYIWYKNGVSIPAIVSTSFFNFIATSIFFPVSAYWAIIHLEDEIPSGFINHLMNVGFSVFLTLLVLMFIALYMDNIFKILLGFFVKIVTKLSKKWGEKLNERTIGFNDKMVGYRKQYFDLLRKEPWKMILALIITFVMYFNKYVLAYVFCLAFGVQVNFWDIIAVMSIIYILLYFAPTPGGSGIAEVSMTAFLAPWMTKNTAASIAIMHRSFLILIPAILGAIVIISQLRKDAKVK